ncbi:MAG: phosphatidylserine decarboxylase family protein [Acidobacteriota bacterium]|jgi:phosphatidylserine decarboxylase
MIRDAYRFLIPTLLLGILFVALNFTYAAILFFILSLFIGFFFRNPFRQVPEGKNLIVSPADGKIVKISQTEIGESCISIFLNIFNVHVNRSPIAGELEQLQYKKGKFKVAFDEEASNVNEQNIITISGEDIQVTFKQIAGLIARRVVCWKQPGSKLERGELLGLIRFGSRVDIILPAKVRVSVSVGDKVCGGSSILGDYK